jgi:hypothetical protein
MDPEQADFNRRADTIKLGLETGAEDELTQSLLVLFIARYLRSYVVEDRHIVMRDLILEVSETIGEMEGE